MRCCTGPYLFLPSFVTSCFAAASAAESGRLHEGSRVQGETKELKDLRHFVQRWREELRGGLAAGFFLLAAAQASAAEGLAMHGVPALAEGAGLVGFAPVRAAEEPLEEQPRVNLLGHRGRG